jgi:hypothetical protein
VYVEDVLAGYGILLSKIVTVNVYVPMVVGFPVNTNVLSGSCVNRNPGGRLEIDPVYGPVPPLGVKVNGDMF